MIVTVGNIFILLNYFSLFIILENLYSKRCDVRIRIKHRKGMDIQ